MHAGTVGSAISCRDNGRRDRQSGFWFAEVNTFCLGEKRCIQFRAEAFNLFNHANFDLPFNSEDGEQIFTFLGFERPASARRIFSTVADAREIQVGWKFLF